MKNKCCKGKCVDEGPPANYPDHGLIVESNPEEGYILAEVIGHTVDVASNYLSNLGFGLRTTVIDGRPLFVTCDFVPKRVNVSVNGGVITAVLGMG